MCIENLVFLKILMKQERTASPQAAQVHGIKNVQEWTIKCLQLFTKTGLTNSSVQDKFEDIALWASIFIEPYFTDCLRCTMHIRPLTLSGRQKKILSNFNQIFYKFCMDVHGIQIRWNFCEIYFRFKDRTFYLVFDFLTVHKHFTFNLCHFLQHKESILSNSNPFEFFQYHFPFRK